MKVLFQVIHRIDYKNHKCTEVEASEEMQNFITQLLNQIFSNQNVQSYRGRKESQVIQQAYLIRQAAKGAADGTEEWNETVKANADAIAQRLLLNEVEVQRKLQPTGSNVQDGSLVQALICEDSIETARYVLAKVGHITYFDGKNYKLRTGFPVHQKNIWKSCILDISQGTARIYSNTEANYWTNHFLQLDQIKGNADNTLDVYDAVDYELRRFFSPSRMMIKKNPKAGFKNPYAQYDFMIIQDAITAHLSTCIPLNYSEMVSEFLDHYQAQSLTTEEQNALKQQLLELKGFDKSFLPDPEYINRCASRHWLSDGIELLIRPKNKNLKDCISIEEDEGYVYLKIKVASKDIADDVMDTVEDAESFEDNPGE